MHFLPPIHLSPMLVFDLCENMQTPHRQAPGPQVITIIIICSRVKREML